MAWYQSGLRHLHFPENYRCPERASPQSNPGPSSNSVANRSRFRFTEAQARSPARTSLPVRFAQPVLRPRPAHGALDDACDHG